MKKRIFSFFMVFTLCFVNVNQVYADAGSLLIAGGSVATIGAGAVAGPAVVAVFCAMMAFGMNVELTQASEEAGMTKTEFLKTKIQQYCDEANMSYNTFNNYVLEQAKVFQNGAISIGSEAGKLIEKFCNWLFQTDAVESGQSDVIVVDGVTYPTIGAGENGVIASFNVQSGTHRDVLYAYNQGDYPLALAIIKTSERYELIVFSKQAFQNVDFSWRQLNTTTNEDDGSGTVTTYQEVINNCYYNYFHGLNYRYFDVNTFNTTIPIYEGTLESFLNSVNTGIETGQADCITGDQEIYDTNKQVLSPTNGETIVINPNITIPVPVDKDVTIDINEYLDIVQDMIDGLQDDIITAIDDATGVPITIEFDPTQDWDPTIEKEDDTDLPPDDEKTPVVKDDIIPHNFDPDPMKFDLKGIFPFCIPWDVKDMLNKLSASPVAPSYTVNWYIPIINERLIFTVDLSPYNDVASICRNMELLVLCIGLAIVTRQLFLRG